MIICPIDRNSLVEECSRPSVILCCKLQASSEVGNSSTCQCLDRMSAMSCAEILTVKLPKTSELGFSMRCPIVKPAHYRCLVSVASVWNRWSGCIPQSLSPARTLCSLESWYLTPLTDEKPSSEAFPRRLSNRVFRSPKLNA